MSDPTKPPAYEPPDDNRAASSAPTEGQLERELPSVAALDRSPARRCGTRLTGCSRSGG
jgi:hypothetical protein